MEIANLNKFRIQSSITGFKESTLERYAVLKNTQQFMSSDLINENDCTFFELQLQNSNGKHERL